MIPQQQQVVRALEAAKLGFKVFPVHSFINKKCTCGDESCGSPAKHPVLKDWQRVATRDENEVRAIWERYPLANIGILCEGLYVLDIDARHGGEESLQQLIHRHGTAWLETIQACTGGGGRHIFFKLPPNVTAKNTVGFLPGLDIRTGGNAFVVAPGSVHKSGNLYSWDTEHHPSRVPIAEVPDWLLELASKKQKAPTPAAEEESAKIPEGRRNDMLFKKACELRSKMTEQELRACLRALNSELCAPPLPEEEVENIISSALRYESELKPLRCLASTQLKRTVWRWSKRLAYGKLHILAGRGGTGKSTIAVDIAYRISTGKSFPGDACVTHEPRGVVWLSPDGESLEEELGARLLAAGCPPERVFFDEEFSLPHGVEGLKKRIEKLEANVGLIVVDSLGPTVSRKFDLNSLQDVRAALKPLVELAKESNSIVLVIHHFNKMLTADWTTRMSGSEGIRDAARVVLAVIEDGKERYLGIAKSNYDEEPGLLPFAIEKTAFSTPDGAVYPATKVVWHEETGMSLRDIEPTPEEERAGLEDLVAGVATLCAQGELEASAEDLKNLLKLPQSVTAIGILLRKALKRKLFDRAGVSASGPHQVRRGATVRRCYNFVALSPPLRSATSDTGATLLYYHKENESEESTEQDQNGVALCESESATPDCYQSRDEIVAPVALCSTYIEGATGATSDTGNNCQSTTELEQHLDRLAALLIEQIRQRGEYRIPRNSPGFAQVAYYVEEFKKRISPTYTLVEEKDGLVARPALSKSDIDLLRESKALWDDPHFLARQLEVPLAAVQNAIAALKKGGEQNA